MAATARVRVAHARAPGAFTTMSNYNRQGCISAYLIDANDYVGLTTVLGQSSSLNAFRNAVVATNQAACEKQRVGLYVWSRNADSTTSYVGGHWVWGQWSAPSTCTTHIAPYFRFQIGASGSTDYRFALTARTYATAGDSGSKYTKNAIESFALSTPPIVTTTQAPAPPPPPANS